MKDGRLQASDLMIGDWVDANGHKEVVEQIERSILKTNDWAYDWKGSVIRPIPLTKEILEKNGFIRDMFYGEWQFDLDPFPFSVVQRENNSWYLGREEHGIAHNREIIDISYVHELQHALRLCKIEKEIEL